MKVRIGDYKGKAQAVYAIVKEESGEYVRVIKTGNSVGEKVTLRDYAICEIADWLDSKGVTKAQQINVFAEAVLG